LGFSGQPVPGGLTPEPERLTHHRDTEDTEKGGNQEKKIVPVKASKAVSRSLASLAKDVVRQAHHPEQTKCVEGQSRKEKQKILKFYLTLTS
jgi:hypothetical protein